MSCRRPPEITIPRAFGELCPADQAQLTALVDAALAEDLGAGDLTTGLTVPAELSGRAVVVAKQDLVLAGVVPARHVFTRLDAGVQVRFWGWDGDRLAVGATAAELAGSLRSLLTGERTFLNFLCHLSGIATLAARCAAEVAGTGCQILDTRKTTPGLRRWEKAAAAAGGARNHRYGLDDAILIKNNHLAAAGGVTAALQRAKAGAPGQAIEIEVRSLAELQEALALAPDVVLLDNFSLAEVAEAVRLNAGRAKLEVSGNLRPGNLRPLADLGVDYLSLGLLTHSAPAADLAMRITVAP